MKIAYSGGEFGGEDMIHTRTFRATLVLSLLIACGGLAGCSTWEKLDRTEKGAVIGGGAGTVIGAEQGGAPGALIGGAAGAAGGGLIGRATEEDDDE